MDILLINKDYCKSHVSHLNLSLGVTSARNSVVTRSIIEMPYSRREMGELRAKLGLDELAGGAAGLSRALLAEFIGT